MPVPPPRLRDPFGFALVALLGLAGASGLLLLVSASPDGAPSLFQSTAAGTHRWSSRLLLAGALAHAYTRTRVAATVAARPYLLGASLFLLLLLEHVGGIALAGGPSTTAINALASPTIHHALLPLGILALAVVHVAQASGGRWTRDDTVRPRPAIAVAAAACAAALVLGWLARDAGAWPSEALSRLDQAAPGAAIGLCIALAASLAAFPHLGRWPGLARASAWLPIVFLGVAMVVRGR